MSPPDDDNNPTETTTLLSPRPLSPFSSSSPTPFGPSSSTKPPSHRFYNFHLSPLWSALLTVASLGLLFNMGVNIAQAPSLAILQGIICRNYYEDRITDGVGMGGGLRGGEIPTKFEDDRCKIGPVQSEVAEVSAWKDVWEVLPAVIMAIPFGIITDRIGRKKVLLLALFGMLLNEAWIRLIYGFPDFFPVRAVWLGGLFQAIGGGSTTFTSIAYVLVADVCPAEERSTAFGYLLAATIIARFLFVPIGGALISVDPWIGMSLGFLVEIVGFFVVVVFVHETLPTAPSLNDASMSGAESQLTLVGTDTNGITPRQDGEEDEEETAKKTKTVKQRVEGYLVQAQEAGNWTVQNPKVVLLLLCFGLYMMGEQAEMLLMIQYASKRLGWSLGKASLLPSLGALTNLFTLLFLLPFLSSLLSPTSHYPSFQMSESRKDTLLAQLFAFCLALGSLFIALPIPTFGFLASSEILYSAGAAFSVPLRSLITNLVDARHRATLYTVISVFTYGAVSVGRPVAAGLFSAGLRMGDDQKGDGMEWMGLPYLVAAGMFVVVFGVVSFGGFGRGGLREREREGEEGVEGVVDEVVDEERVGEERYRD